MGVLSYISKFVIQVGIGTTADFVDETHLKELVDDLEDEVLGVEVVKLAGYPSVDLVEVHAFTSFVTFKFFAYEMFQLVSLVTDLV